MTQRLPASNSDRVSPRRRFHRPAAEFLGARRQVPVLTGLPSVEAQPFAEPEEQRQPERVEEGIYPEMEPAPMEPAPDVVAQAMETPVEETLDIHGETLDSHEETLESHEETLDIHEVSPQPQTIENPWREWAYPVAGTLIASLLVYTAWSGLSQQAPPEPARQNEATFHAAAESASVVVTPPSVVAVAPPSPVVQEKSVPAASPSIAKPTRFSEPTEFAESTPDPESPAVAVETVNTTPATQVATTNTLMSHKPPAKQPFVEAPIVFSESPRKTTTGSPQFIEHDVSHWEVSSPQTKTSRPEVASKPEVTAAPPTDSASVILPPEEPVAAPTPEIETRVPEIPFVAAGPADGFQEELTVGEPTEADYPTTEYSDELPPAPQAAIERSQPLDNSQDFAATVAPTLNAPGQAAPSTRQIPPPITPAQSATPNGQLIDYPVANPQPIAGSPAWYPGVTTPAAALQAQHVVVNPHFQSGTTQPANEQPAFQTANVMAGPASSRNPAADTTLNTFSPTTNKTNSIYGSFPTHRAPAQPSIDQVRLNGSIEPYSQTRR